MIYLIDDNQSQQNTIPDIYEDSLKIVRKIQKKGDYAYLEHLNFLNNAECILLHDGTLDVDENKKFIPGSKTNVTKIKEDISDFGKKIPLVVFSLGMDEEAKFNSKKNPYCVYEINKNIFYNRLQVFLKKYLETNHIELSLIAYGEEQDLYKLRILLDEILQKISGLNGDKRLEISNIPIDKLRVFLDILLPKKDYNDILNQIEDKKISIQDYKSKIISFFESYKNYGKNIYDW